MSLKELLWGLGLRAFWGLRVSGACLQGFGAVCLAVGGYVRRVRVSGRRVRRRFGLCKRTLRNNILASLISLAEKQSPCSPCKRVQTSGLAASVES